MSFKGRIVNIMVYTCIIFLQGKNLYKKGCNYHFTEFWDIAPFLADYITENMTNFPPKKRKMINLKVMLGFFHYWGKQAKKIILFDIYLFKKMIALKYDFNGWQITKNSDFS